MKISPRTVLKIARLYQLADDNTPVKALRHLKVQTDESHIVAEFILNKQHFAVLYGSIVDEESIDELWPGRPANTEILPNPLDPNFTETPFQGKFVMMFCLSARAGRPCRPSSTPAKCAGSDCPKSPSLRPRVHMRFTW